MSNLVNIDINDAIVKLGSSITLMIRKICMTPIEKIRNRIDIKGLTKSEKLIIQKYYSKELDEFTSCGQTISFSNSETLHIVDKLCRRKILISQSEIEIIMNYNGYGVVYNLNSNAIKKLNRKRIKRYIFMEETKNDRNYSKWKDT